MEEAMLDWRELDPDELEYQFNPQRSVTTFGDDQVRRTEISQQTRANRRAFLDLAYGAGYLQRIDIFPAEQDNAPVHLFFHGGYWRTQDKENFAFVAELLAPLGICTGIVNYPLCPRVTLDKVVYSARKAIAWTARSVRAYGGDPYRITLSGNSAGAHLIAMALATDWQEDFELPADVIKGAVAISGIYDPAPAMHISVNEELNLTDEIVARNDALAIAPRRVCPIDLFVGGAEPPHWIAQTERYADHLNAHGLAPTVTIVPEAHHFTIMNGYLDPATPMAQRVIKIATAA